ncbi:glutamate racemase [Desulfovibrio litoralis]|uniref:Glutamate racemase n=1 Tax=Desulfovibrio litoralis DSM 11393 TaxID=1121455 RepID=A0A1M7SAK4_9BACT|nr:glutamate racemase [Desulfovibrio litoralis]SHN55465.1 glutamate racemase [Desulfovibrio litoralis DSM 11393]
MHSTSNKTSLSNNQAIGIFDSGVGGLTVFKAVQDLLPDEDIIYLGDTARLPYGTKSAETVNRYALRAAQKLLEYNIKALVIACNTATAAALTNLQKTYPDLPVIGVIQPGAEAACQVSKNGNICVLATEGTIRSGAYQQAIKQINATAKINGLACPLFVSLAEEGWHEGEIAEAVAKRYLDKIFSVKANIPDTIVLGCTHFPLLKKAVAKAVGEQVKLVDSALISAQALKKALEDNNLSKNYLKQSPPQSGTYSFLTTDDTERFARIGSRFLGVELNSKNVTLVDI